MSLMILGTVAIDNIKTTKEERKNLLGGSASYCAMSARLFTEVEIISVIGEDFPQEHIKTLEDKGIRLDSLTRLKGKTFQWDGEYSQDDWNNAKTLQTELGVLLEYVPEVKRNKEEITHLFLGNFDPGIQKKSLESINKEKTFIGMDTMNLWLDIKKSEVEELIKQVNLFILNDSEAKMLTNENNLIQAIKKINKMGPEIVIIKKGENGVLALYEGELTSYCAYPIEEVIDPTGAGDTFAGAIMGIIHKENKINQEILKKSLKYATIMSSFNVQGFGMNKIKDLNKELIDERLNKYMKYIK